jgi:hypothetical protein
MNSFLSVRQGGGPLLVSHDLFKDEQKGIEANPINGITSGNRHNPCEDGEDILSPCKVNGSECSFHIDKAEEANAATKEGDGREDESGVERRIPLGDRKLKQ